MGRRARQRHRSGESANAAPAKAAPAKAATAKAAPAKANAAAAKRPARAALRGARKTMDARRPAGLLRVERRPDRERPRAPWHPLPVSEIVLVAGIVGVIVGVSRGPDR